LPLFQPLIHKSPLESAHTRRSPAPSSGGSINRALPSARLTCARWLPASETYQISPSGVAVMP
jgi:hypothetical protein